jgi:glycosyltransferase involved in cell wall biosynthesis
MLEAMRCGVAVITSNTSSMPEITGGEAAYIIDPFKPEQITEGIIKLLKDEKLRNELIEKGFKQSKKFSWENMAKDVLSLYDEVYKKHYR